jgi:hypothetical protein
MVTLSQPTKMISDTIHRATRSRHDGTHHTAGIVGWVVLGLVILGAATFLPDFIRYMRIRRM